VKTASFLLIAIGPPALAFGLRGFNSPFWWIGIAWLGASLGWLGVHWRKPLSRLWAWSDESKTIGPFSCRPRAALGDALAVAVLGLLAFAILPEAAMGRRPVDHDHTVHFFKAWNLWENFIAEGRLRGWSHLWFAGYPAQYLYPIGTDLFVGFVKYATFGALSLGAAYGVAFFLFYLFKALAIYALARVSVGAWAGLLAGIFYLGDEGSFRFGGWVYTAVWGVWPQGLSITFGLFAMACLPGILKRRSWWPVIAFGLFLGMALLTHPVQIIHFALVGPVALLAAMLASDVDGKRLSGAFRLSIGYLAGIGIASVWIVPFLSVSEFSEKYGVGWRTLYETGSDLYELHFIDGSWVFATALGVVGLVVLLFSRKTIQTFIGLMTFVLLSASATNILADFNFVELSDSFKFVQWQRISMLLKPFLFIAAGAAIVQVVTLLADRFDTASDDERSPVSRWSMAARIFVVLSLVLPLSYGFVDTVRKKQFLRNLTEVQQRPRRAAIEKFVKWANQEWDDREVPFYRVAAYVSHDDHSFVDVGVRIPMPMYKTGFMPAAIYRHKPKAKSVETFEELNVRYVLAPRKLPARSYELVEDLGQSTYVYELKTWKKDPFVVHGNGEVELVSWADEEIVLRAAEGSSGRLQLNVSYFDRWRAYRDGEALEIATETSSADKYLGFMSVDLAPGTYRFAFERQAPELWGWILFVLGLGLIALLVLFELGKPALFGRAKALLQDVIDWIEIFEDWQKPALARAAFAGLVAIGLTVSALAYWTPPLYKDKKSPGVIYDFTDHLARADVFEGTRRCGHVLGRHHCGDNEWEHVYATFRDVGDDWRTCVWAHPPKSNKPLKIRFRDVPRGGQIEGWYGISASGQVRQNWPVKFSVAVDGIELDELTTTDDEKRYTFALDVPEGDDEMDVTFDISADNNARRHFCFRAAVTR